MVFWGRIFKGLVLFLFFSCASPPETRQPEWRRQRNAGGEVGRPGPASQGDVKIGRRDDFEYQSDEAPPISGSKILEALPSVEFEWPVRNPFVTDFFGWRKKKLHEGIDLRAPTGTPIFASAPGEVIYADRRIKFYGRMVVLDHGGGWSSLYAHLSKINVKMGQIVQGGEKLGNAGRTGRASGPHLHFEIRKGADPVDPLLFLPEL